METKTDFKNKTLHFKNLSPEERNKYIAYVFFGVVFCGIMYYGISNYTNEEEREEVTEFSNPEAEQSKYNTKLEALNPKGTEQSTNNLEYTFSETKEDQPISTEGDLASLDRQLSAMGSRSNSQSTSTEITGVSRTQTSKPSNSHDVYGNYSMWQDKEPSNSKIGYESKKYSSENFRTTPKSPSTPSYSEVKSNQSEIPIRETVYPNYEEPKVQVVYQVIKAKLISQGEASNNRSISFVLLESFDLNGETIPKTKSYAIGVIKLDKNRVFAKINTIKANGKTYNVRGNIIGHDGEEGLPLIIEENSTNVEGVIKDEAVRQVGSRIPLVGGVVSRIATGNSNTKTSKVSLSGNIECTIAIYK